jgi:polysaccharide export outer membrane protein
MRRGEPRRIDLQALIDGSDLSQDVLLQDGDVLQVPDRSNNRVFVLGEVLHPSIRHMYKGRMSLADALGQTEGTNPLTSSGRIYVIRGGLERPSIYRLDASSADALLLAVGFPLEPLDVVFVSTYELTRWDRVIAQIAPTIQGIWEAAYVAQTVRAK